MRWVVAMSLFAASSWFLYKQYTKQVAAPPPVAQQPPAAPPVKPAPVLNDALLKKVRKDARDGVPGVRWAAMELLFTLGDPSSVPLLEKAIANDPEPDIKLKALKLLASDPGKMKVQGLVKGLRDPDKDVRLAALKALEAVGDPSAAHWVAQVAETDYEPEVRVEAMRALGVFQDKRRADFEALAARLREQYESAVERAQKAQKEDIEKPDLQEAPALPKTPQ